MKLSRVHEPSIELNDLLDHIHERTFGRLHNVSVTQVADGRIVVSAIAHSRFVGQLAEWAVLEKIAPHDVDLAIQVCRPSIHSNPIFHRIPDSQFITD